MNMLFIFIRLICDLEIQDHLAHMVLIYVQEILVFDQQVKMCPNDLFLNDQYFY